jgi:hypothetical protein
MVFMNICLCFVILVLSHLSAMDSYDQLLQHWSYDKDMPLDLNKPKSWTAMA